jgi:hypothetical protein
LGFALGFDTNLKDDYSLGVRTGRAPDVIVQNDLYRAWLRDSGKYGSVELQQSLLAVMARYHPAFSEGEYVVFTPGAQPIR